MSDCLGSNFSSGFPSRATFGRLLDLTVPTFVDVG